MVARFVRARFPFLIRTADTLRRRLSIRKVLGMAVVLAAASSWPPVVSAAPERPVELEVWMMTFGPGGPVFLKFGHNALLIRGRDAASDRVLFERVYDYGLFNGASPTLVADFLQGRMDYWVAVTTLSRTMGRYRYTNRDVAAQKLRLTPEQSAALYEMLELNIQPENRFYRYDYYYDNCSTRLRDALDRITDGALRRAFIGPATMSLRDHSLRHTANDWKYYLGLDVGLANVDAPINLWVESFLPQKFREALRKVEVPVGDEMRPFVEKEEVWFDGTRPEVPDRPPARGWLMMAIGTAIGALVALLGRRGRDSAAARRVFAVVASLVALGLGFFGVLLIYLWGFTDHSIAYANENIFHLAPWGVVLPLAAILSPRWFTRGLVAAAGLSALGLVIKVVPAFGQDTYRIIGLLLPVWIGLAVGARGATRERTPV